jgi:hypothetical protein
LRHSFSRGDILMNAWWEGKFNHNSLWKDSLSTKHVYH